MFWKTTIISSQATFIIAIRNAISTGINIMPSMLKVNKDTTKLITPHIKIRDVCVQKITLIMLGVIKYSKLINFF